MWIREDCISQLILPDLFLFGYIWLWFCSVHQILLTQCWNTVNSILLHSIIDPSQVVGDSGIDSICSLLTTVNPPTDNPSSPKRPIITQGEGASTVTLAGVLATFRESSTKHVICQIWYIGLCLLRQSDWSTACLLLHHRQLHVFQLIC